MQFGCKVRYLPSAEREVEKREKIDPSLRYGLFVGYRQHTGGRWSEQYGIIDFKAYAQIGQHTGRCAYVHYVSDIYVPGITGDDPEKHPAYPVAEGLLREAKAESDAESAEDPVDNVQDLATDMDVTLLSFERTSGESPDPSDAGGGAQYAHTADEQESEPRLPDRDRWLIEGDYFVRRHHMPRTTLLSRLDVPDDPPCDPIGDPPCDKPNDPPN